MTRFSALLFWFSLAIAASVGLYNTSYRVHDLSQKLYATNRSIEAEQRDIHVLKAEWVYLSNPARIEQAAKKHLALRATALPQVAQMRNLRDVLPSRTEALAEAHVTTLPIALPAPVATVASRTDDDHTHVNTRLVIQHGASALAAGAGQMVLARMGVRP